MTPSSLSIPVLKYGLYVFIALLALAYVYGYLMRSRLRDVPKIASYAIKASEATPLGTALAPALQAHSPHSGFHLIANGQDALLMRLAMIEAAQRSLDIQYYSFQNDETGKLLLEALLRAAERGVRVRILLDSITVKKTDSTWALLGSHRHIELRIFNPFNKPEQNLAERVLHFFSNFSHFTKRMHNKVFIADNQLALIGGRNLGDAYFDKNQSFNFRDIDVLSVGPVNAAISQSFDNFWNNDAAYRLYKPKMSTRTLEELQTSLKHHWSESISNGLLPPVPDITKQLKEESLPLLWADAILAADPASKVMQPKEIAGSKPISALEKYVASAQHEFIAVSPYLVPGKEGVETFSNLVKRGVTVSILTNSLGATDVVAVHAGYRRYRPALIAGGVNLYETKPLPGKHPRSGRFASASRVSLHTKIYIIDRKEVFIGTMNLDPRSVQLNTELTLIIHSPEIAQQLVSLFHNAIQNSSSYRVLVNNGKMEWVIEEKNKEIHYNHEPKAGLWRTIKVNLYALLPFENQL